MKPHVALLLILSLASVTRGDEPLPAQARAVLTKHCYRCHGENGKAVAGVFVLQRDRLVARKKLVPGEPAKSRLFASVTDGEMPPAEEKVRPTTEEIAILRKWIADGAKDFAPAAPKRAFVRNEAVLGAI